MAVVVDNSTDEKMIAAVRRVFNSLLPSLSWQLRHPLFDPQQAANSACASVENQIDRGRPPSRGLPKPHGDLADAAEFYAADDALRLLQPALSHQRNAGSMSTPSAVTRRLVSFARPTMANSSEYCDSVIPCFRAAAPCEAMQ